MRRALTYRRFLPVQIFTGALPFSASSSFIAALAIVRGNRPPRPTHPTFTDDLWKVMQCCWNQDPCLRPTISEVVPQVLTLSVCNRLIGHTFTTPERVSLIGTIFLDNDPVAMVENFPRGDAQILIDVVNEVSPARFHVQGAG